MIKIHVILGDNDDPGYRKEADVIINGIDYLVVRDNGDTCDDVDYHIAFDNVTQAVESQVQGLPYSWYFIYDGIYTSSTCMYNYEPSFVDEDPTYYRKKL